MTFINDQKEVIREIVQQAEGFFSLFPVVKKSGIVLDTFAVAGLLDHLDIIQRPLAEAMCFNKPRVGSVSSSSCLISRIAPAFSSSGIT